VSNNANNMQALKAVHEFTIARISAVTK